MAKLVNEANAEGENNVFTQLSVCTAALISLAVNAARTDPNDALDSSLFREGVLHEAKTALKKAGYDDETLALLGL